MVSNKTLIGLSLDGRLDSIKQYTTKKDLKKDIANLNEIL